MPLFKPDIPFARDDANRFLPWIIGFMAFLAALLLHIGLTLDDWAAAHKAKVASGFTVHVPYAESGMADAVKKVQDWLEHQPGVESVKPVAKEDLQALLKPWLGGASELDNLPLPAVLEAHVKPGAAMDYDAMRKQLSALSPGAELDAQELWVAKFSAFSAALKWLVYGIASCLLATLSATVVFTSRAGLKLHERTVGLLHMIGAQDRYIVRQFQRNAWNMALLGSFCGTLAAFVLALALKHFAATLDVPMLALRLSLKQGIGYALLPFACALLALLSARIAILRQLERIL